VNPARDVRKLMSKHDPPMRFGPIDRILGQKNHRSERAPRKRSAHDRAGIEKHWLVHARVLALIIENAAPIRTIEWPGAACDATKPKAPDREPAQDGDEPGRPQEWNDREQVKNLARPRRILLRAGIDHS